MRRQTGLIQISNQILLIAVAVATANFSTFAAHRPPTVRVLAPSPAGDFTVWQNFQVEAEAQADAGRRMVEVEFFVWPHNLRVGEARFNEPAVMVEGHCEPTPCPLEPVCGECLVAAAAPLLNEFET